VIDIEDREMEDLLRRVASTGPNPQRVSQLALGAVRHHSEARRHRAISLRIALPSAALAPLVLVWLLFYFVPVAENTADAAAPGLTQPQWLDRVGLSVTDLTVTGATMTSSGVSVKVDGVYADAIRTVIVMHSSGGLLDPNTASIDDQFFHRYTVLDAVSNAQTGVQIMTFAPFQAPANSLGARIHFAATRTLGESPVSGRWNLEAVVLPKQAHSIAVPGGHIGNWDATFESVTSSGSSVSVQFLLDGPPVELTIPDAAGGKPKTNLAVELFGPSGQLLPSDMSVDVQGSSTRVTAIWVGITKGSYQFKLTLSGDTLTRQFDVGSR
jgi:hypothetical protein